jgi:hypothetical protein
MSKTKVESAYMSIAASLPCACCGDAAGVELHHAREEQGIAERAGNFLVIPLCRACHGQDLGSQGFHGDKTLMRIFKTDEMKMLNQTIGEVFKRVAKL